MTGEGGVTPPKAAHQDWVLSVRERKREPLVLKRVYQVESHKVIDYIIFLFDIKPVNSLQSIAPHFKSQSVEQLLKDTVNRMEMYLGFNKMGSSLTWKGPTPPERCSLGLLRG